MKAHLGKPTVPRYRARRPGPEAEMVSKVLHVSLASLAGDSVMLFEQPELPTGAPDVVAVSFSGHKSLKRNCFSVGHLRVAHYLYIKKIATIETLGADLMLAESLARRIVFDLNEVGYIQHKKNIVKLRRISAIFDIKKIVAIEAKISNWRQAIDQAIANSWFASHSYILLPQNRNIEEVLKTAKKQGIGVLVFDGSKVKSILKPRPRKIPSSYGSWLFNEWVNSAVGG